MRSLYAPMALLLMLNAASCVTYTVDEGAQPGTRVMTPGTQAALNRVVMLTDGLQQRVAVQRTNADRTDTNTLRVWATFRNRTDFPQQVQARVQFFGPNREPLEGPTAWVPVFLPPNSIGTYRQESAGVDLAYYYIEVQEMP